MLPLLIAFSLLPTAQASRPNVVVIVTDDQGWADVGFNNAAVHSPRIDALAREGLVLSQHYVMPQCTPTRVALMTGRYPSRFGAHAQEATNEPAFPRGTPTLGTMFKAAGYETNLVGKWHLGSLPEHGPNAFGFDASYGSLGGAVGMYDHRYRSGDFEHTWHRDGVLVEGHENGVHATDLVAREAVRIIEGDHEAPFFLYLAFHAVHTPLDERGRFTARPTQLDPAEPTRWLDEDEIEWFHDDNGRIQAEQDPERRLFLAAVHHMDHAIGEVLDALERTGARKDTLILFTSDNGPQGSWPGGAYPNDLKLTDFNQPQPWRGKKTDVWEGGIHVPGFVVWPDHIAPGVQHTLTHVVDWIPTLASLVGAEAPAGDGIDMSRTWLGLDDAASRAHRELYWVWSRASNRWALRHGDWKMVLYGAGAPTAASPWQLYDLRVDPREEHDLAVARPEMLTELYARFVRQRSRDAR
jgi:arylsulfatase A-like enzyme